jgi:hypothetical protein
MKRVTKETLERMTDEFPTYDWTGEELEELVAPQYGMISGFQDMLKDIRLLQEEDLEDIGPAGNL